MSGLVWAASTALTSEKIQIKFEGNLSSTVTSPLWQRQTVLSDIQDPNAWVLSSEAGSIRPDTSTYARGTQSLEITTTGDFQRPTSADLALPGVDMTDCQWDLWLRAETTGRSEASCSSLVVMTRTVCAWTLPPTFAHCAPVPGAG